jgi:hypothetical protein
MVLLPRIRLWPCIFVFAGTLACNSYAGTLNQTKNETAKEIPSAHTSLENKAQTPQQAEAEIFSLLDACFNNSSDTRPLHIFIGLIIAHLQKYKEYFKAKYPTISIDTLITALQTIQYCKSANKIGWSLKNYKFLLPENIQQLSIFAMRSRIANRLKHG